MSEQKNVLLVDDDPDLVELNKIMLEGIGYRVYTAHSGKEGREKASEVDPDLIILDVMMETELAGLETARWLRDNPDTKTIPIIMLTGVNQQGNSFKFGPDEVWLPVDEFIEKPLDSKRLAATVNKILS